MAQFMKKASLGRMIASDAGIIDPDVIEVRLTVEEYKELFHENRRLEEMLTDFKQKRDLEIKRIRQNAEKYVAEKLASEKEKLFEYQRQSSEKVNQIRRMKDEAEEKLSEMVDEVHEKDAEIERVFNLWDKQYSLNGNLIRIIRERANAIRGIVPKKKHDGYLVLSSRQWNERYNHELTLEEYQKKPEEFRRWHQFPYTEHLTVKVWKSVIQTPYDASLPIRTVSDLVECHDFLFDDILKELGCEDIAEREGYDEFDRNTMYKKDYIANYRSGFWEIEIYTTKNLRVPEGRRPVQKVLK